MCIYIYYWSNAIVDKYGISKAKFMTWYWIHKLKYFVAYIHLHFQKNTMFIQRTRHIVIEKEIYSNNSHPIIVLRLTHSILYCVFDNPFNESKLYSINSRAFILDCFPIKLTVSIDITLQSNISWFNHW